jgi:hypothetical protein
MTKHHKSLLKKLLLTFGLIGPASGIYPFGIIPILQRFYKQRCAIGVQAKRRKLARYTLNLKLREFNEKWNYRMHEGSTPNYRTLCVLILLQLGRLNLEVFASSIRGTFGSDALVVLELYGLKSARTEDLVAKSDQEFLDQTARHHYGYHSEYHVRSCYPFLDSPGQATYASQTFRFGDKVND